MKTKILSLLAAVGLAGSASAAVTLSGTALLNAPGLVAGQEAAYVVGVPTGGAGSLDAGPVGLGEAFNGTGPLVGLGGNNVQSVFGNLSLGAGVNFEQGALGLNVAGQQFSVIVFASSPAGQASPGDSFSFWTDPSWIVPVADGGFSFGSQFDQLSSAPDGSGTVVPEPSTYAMLAGALALVAVMIRRRK